MPELSLAELTLRIALAAGLGAAIGLERELREREAGLRTHLLVSLGAALFTLVSAYGWSDWQLLERRGHRLRPDPDRRADRHRGRLPRRRRDHPPGPDGPRPDDRGDALGGGRDRDGRRSRLLRGGRAHDGGGADQPLAAARARLPPVPARPAGGATARDRAAERCQRAARAGRGRGARGRGRVAPARALARRAARRAARGVSRGRSHRRSRGWPTSRTSGRCVGARSAAGLGQPAQARRAEDGAAGLDASSCSAPWTTRPRTATTHYENARGEGAASGASRRPRPASGCWARTPGSRSTRSAAAPACTPRAGRATTIRSTASWRSSRASRTARRALRLRARRRRVRTATELRATGRLDGRIAPERRGSEGFGYDPIFVPEGEERTVAELGDAWKSENSHRARAARALAEQLDTSR